MKKFYFYGLAVLLAGLIITVVAFAWTNPVGAPTIGAGNITSVGANVGIGTTAPEGRLHVVGNIVQNNTNTLQARNAAGTVESWMWPRWSDNVMYTNFGAGGWNIRNNASAPVMFMTAAGNVGIGTAAPGSTAGVARVLEVASGAHAGIVLTDNDVEGGRVELWNDQRQLHLWDPTAGHRMTWAANGNVGIGTATPGHRLDVVGDIRAQGGWLRTTGNTGWWNETWGSGLHMSDAGWIRSTGPAGLWMGSAPIGTNGSLTIGYGGHGGPVGGAIIAGNVGIGTVAPATRLEIRGVHGDTQLRLFSSNAPHPSAILNMWASEPHHTWTGVGIANNITNWLHFPRVDTTRGGSYIRLLDSGIGMNVVNSAGADTRAITIDSAGNVGIGTVAPAARLDLGGGNITGVSKLSVNVIDPVYKINNKKYATFVPDMIGLKAEVVGQAQLENGKFEIDLAKAEYASDLWLFFNIIQKDSIIPFISSQNSALIYSRIDGSRFVAGLIDGQKDAKFSFRLIADRIDADKEVPEGFLYNRQDTETYIDVNSF